jgi:hypothetical protein
MSARTIEEDFQHFLSYSGLSGERPDVIEKMRRAFEAAWEPAALRSELAQARKLLEPFANEYASLSDEQLEEADSPAWDEYRRCLKAAAAFFAKGEQ